MSGAGPAPARLRSALRTALAPSARRWLAGALADVRDHPPAIGPLHAAAGRHVGRAPLAGVPGWAADEAARALLVTALGPGDAAVLAELHRFADPRERAAIVAALPLVAHRPGWGDVADDIVARALRSDDPRLVGTALRHGADRLDDRSFRAAVLKAVVLEIPLASVPALPARADAALGRMLAGLARERRAAGRPVPADAAGPLAGRAGPAPVPALPPDPDEPEEAAAWTCSSRTRT